MTPPAPIYLDYNASTPVLPEVFEAMLPHLRGQFGNPSSAHPYGQRERAAVTRARRQVAALLGCDEDEIVFTSGGTESNNLAIRGVAEARPEQRRIITTEIEHPATARPCEWLETRGWQVTRLSVDSGGRARVSDARTALTAGAALLTVMHANNETGVLQPVGELAALAHDAGALVHTDAAQSVGKVTVRARDLGVDLLSLAGHKLYAPKGVGALYVRQGTPLAPLLLGSSAEHGLRPGTENVASIVGLGAACEAAARDLAEVSKRVSALRDELWQRLTADVAGLALNGHPEPRLPNTLNARFPAVSGAALLACTPEIAASTGSACHDGNESASAAILAMGVSPAEAIGSVRLSLGRDTTPQDVANAASALIRSWRRLSRREERS